MGKSGRHRNRFLTSNAVWLDEPYVLPESVRPQNLDKAERKPKIFNDCSEKSKKRKIQSLLDSTDPQEIVKASEIVLRKMGKRDSAKLLKDLSEASSSKGTELKKLCKRYSSEYVPSVGFSADEALSLMVDANLSKHQYDVIRQKVNAKCKDLFPSYTNIQKAKKNCYPAELTITEVYAKSSLQSLVNHTIERLCLAQQEVLLGIDELKTGENRINILIKWGCDGAQQKQYKQKFVLEEGHTDESLFSISMVPIQMNFSSSKGKIIVWQNPAPSSTRYCRPIKFVFAKESTELISQEVIWYIMPVSVHKILFHGKDIVRSCILPIGQLSEEAQEARNKDTRKFRELFTRKTSRVDTNTDLFNRLLISSDPFIASLRHNPIRVRGIITKEVLSLLTVDALEEEESFYDGYESE